ncbi:hypothetical protein MIND_00183500 [Mycena indigotica]|uniref:Uncharacterized protein n=1 Tax=Mycena indigotica TaxID=2126181 RepID=A0A8H6T452_9AGAR|nr:uncharacterized protein MIND_00183500 [Mycena indigotica]KAF7311735.1 hypothetical protein MIND_00183500 [Mycena indigotica]
MPPRRSQLTDPTGIERVLPHALLGQRVVVLPDGSLRLEWLPVSPPPTIPTFATVLSNAAHSGMVWQGPTVSFSNPRPLPPPSDAQDVWHRTNGFLPLHYVPALPEIDASAGLPVRSAPVSIPFKPVCGPGTLGVAMAEILAGRGIAEGDRSLSAYISPPFRSDARDAFLIIEWPGHPRFISQVQVQDAAGYLSKRILAMQVANAFYHLAEMVQAQPSADPAALPLGFDQLRLLEVVSFNAQDFYVRVLVVGRPLALP